MDEQHESGKEDVAWLCGEVVRLFRDAAGAPPNSNYDGPDMPDARPEINHPVCVKYAEILLKLLPQRQSPGSRAADAADVAALRRTLQDKSAS